MTEPTRPTDLLHQTGAPPTGVAARIDAVVRPALAEMGYELVRVAVLGRERPTVQLMADRADGRGFTVEDCEAISHAMGAVLDVENPLDGAWTLEVSSAGIDRPLTRLKDWLDHLGHAARVEFELPVAGRRRVIGAILRADALGAALRLENGEEFAFEFAPMRRAKLVLTDALIEATEQRAADPALPH